MLSVHFTIECKTKQQRENLFMTYQHVITRHYLWVGRSLTRQALVKPARQALDAASLSSACRALVELASSCKRSIRVAKLRKAAEFNAKWPFKVIQGHIFRS